MAASWRLAKSLETLRDEVNRWQPRRDKSSDGTIGDPAHAMRVSDHNPNAAGVVRAFDCDAGPGLSPTGVNATVGRTVAEAARRAGAAGHRAMGPGAYVIYDHRIASAISVPPWSWRPYGGTGLDPHTSHPHVSVTTRPGRRGYDSTKAWGLFPPPARRRPKPPTLWWAKAHAAPAKYRTWVITLQRGLGVDDDGIWGPKTTAALARFRRQHKLGRPLRVAGPAVWRLLVKDGA